MQRADEHENRLDAMGDSETRGAVEPQFEHIREADRIREGLEEFWGEKLNRSLEYIREDREALKPYAHRTS